MIASHPEKSNGFTLLEVLIAVFLFSIGLLGLAAIQMAGLKDNQSAYFRTEATIMAYDMADRMRLNKSAAEGGSYNLAMTDSAPTGTTLADTDRAVWLTNISTTLPSGDGAIALTTVSGKQIFTITVQWDDSRATAGSATQSFAMSTEL